MNKITKFYLNHAVYEVGVEGTEAVLLLNYAGNTYEVVGDQSEEARVIAEYLLAQKHAINFAEKFNDRIREGKV